MMKKFTFNDEISPVSEEITPVTEEKHIFCSEEITPVTEEDRLQKASQAVLSHLDKWGSVH